MRSPVQIRATPAQIILFETQSDEQSSILTFLRIWAESILRGQESCQVSEPLLTGEVSRTFPLIMDLGFALPDSPTKVYNPHRFSFAFAFDDQKLGSRADLAVRKAGEEPLRQDYLAGFCG